MTKLSNAIEFMREERRQLFIKIEQRKADGDELGKATAAEVKRLQEIDNVISVLYSAKSIVETVANANNEAFTINTEQ